MTMQHANINGVDLAYRIDGDAGLPWLILTNGLATDHRLWDKQIPALTKSRRVLRYDARGHGSSAAPAPPYTLSDLVGDALGLMDRLEIASTDICGISLGGMTALGLAAAAPDRVSRVICCDARADSPPDYANMWRQRAALVTREGVKSIAEPTIERWFTPACSATPEGKQAISVARDMILATSVAGYSGCAAALSGVNLMDSLPKLKSGIQYVVGSDDRAISPDIMANMARVTPGSLLHTVANAAHLPNLEQPAVFNDVVMQIFDKQ